jgi:hypothetical protein
LLNTFQAPLCPSSGAREYYTDGCCLWYLMLWFSSCRYGVELKAVCPVYTDNLKTKAPNTTGSNHLYNTLELLMMGIMVPETCWASIKICNKKTSVASSWHFISTYFSNVLSADKTLHVPNRNLSIFMIPFFFLVQRAVGSVRRHSSEVKRFVPETKVLVTYHHGEHRNRRKLILETLFNIQKIGLILGNWQSVINYFSVTHEMYLIQKSRPILSEICGIWQDSCCAKCDVQLFL